MMVSDMVIDSTEDDLLSRQSCSVNDHTNFIQKVFYPSERSAAQKQLTAEDPYLNSNLVDTDM